MFKLHIRDDEGRSTSVPLLREEITIGRREGNTIRLTERNVSRRHARLVKKKAKVYLEDLSRYGTRINGQRVKDTTALEAGDVIQIGDYELALDVDEEAAAAGETLMETDAAEGPVNEAQDADSTSLVNLSKLAEAEKGRGKRPRLVALTTNIAGVSYEIEKDEVVVGRTDDADLVVDHRSISRRHCKLVNDGGNWSIVDLESANGLKVNDEDYKQTTLRKGDIIELGHVKLRFVAAGEAYIYDPSAAAAAVGSGSSGPGAGLWIAIAMVVLAIGAGVAWFTVFSKPSKAPATSTRSTGAADDADEKGSDGKSDKVVVKADDPPKNVIKAGPDTAPLLAKASQQMKARKWDEAAASYKSVLGLDASNAEATAGQALAEREKQAGVAYDAVSTRFKDGDHEGAFKDVSKLDAIAADSAYSGQAAELKKTILGNWSTRLADDASAAFRSGNLDKTIFLATKALQADGSNTAARSLRDRARKRKGNDSGSQAATTKTEKTEKKPEPKPEKKPEPAPPAADGGGVKSASDLYKEARKVYSTNPAKAISLYKQAAGKGHVRAWRQLGSMYAQQGNSGEAVKAWKKYLKLKPGASDAEVIRNAIIRHGGTP